MMNLLDVITGSNETENGAKTMESIEVDLHLIDEDPSNPRKFLSDKAEEEMVESIKDRGILQAIVIIPHPDDSTRYVVKDGNRRRRNAIKAGLTTIPAVIKPEFSELDQLTANVMRDDMTIFDLSKSINRLIHNKIAKQKQIGRALGFGEAKTSKFVSLTKDVQQNIIDHLESMHNQGLSRDFSAMYEIVTLSKEYPADVTKWLDKFVASGKSLGMPEVKKLKQQFLATDETTTQETGSLPDYTTNAIIAMTTKGKESLDRISLLTRGEIQDQKEKDDVLKGLAELINDLKVIQKRYK
ncbi:ParB/RepB/Spo0J family partition protein [Acinetobacter gyllenbergii]|uniref:ParB/RepB/Spo0J family partition protein n=1 Tax=Acinetobacter gyllenbergii TaxID=134534 RepID=UPI003F5717C1